MDNVQLTIKVSQSDIFKSFSEGKYHNCPLSIVNSSFDADEIKLSVLQCTTGGLCVYLGLALKNIDILPENRKKIVDLVINIGYNMLA